MFHRTIILLIAVSISLYNALPWQTRPAYAVSIEEERQLGERFLESVRQNVVLVEDDFANDYINDLGNYLIRPLETKPFPFHFYIIKASDLNAFAGPGGHIFIYTGLIEAMTEVDELAAVICHEIGHVSARHVSQRIAQGTKIGLATMAAVLAGAFIGGEAAAPIIIGSTAAGIQKQLSYSRTDERQADQLGFRYMEESGFDPSMIISAFKKLYQRQWLGSDAVPPYLLTHPGGPERMSNIEAMIANHGLHVQKNAHAEEFKASYALFKTILQARYLESQDAKRLFSAELQKDPDSPLAHLGLGIVFKETGELPEAIKQLQIALAGLPETISVLRYLADAYQLNGQDNEAVTILEKALTLNAQDKASLFLLATAYMNMEEYPKAINLYEKLIQMMPVKNEVFYNLGVSYGRADRLALAHYYFGIYFMKLKEIQKARFHFQKAMALSSNDPIFQTRIKKEMQRLN